jgi:hypothetical protein
MKINCKGCGMKFSWPNRGFIPTFACRGWGKQKNFSQYSQCLGRDSNSAPAEYKSKHFLGVRCELLAGNNSASLYLTSMIARVGFRNKIFWSIYFRRTEEKVDRVGPNLMQADFTFALKFSFKISHYNHFCAFEHMRYLHSKLTPWNLIF